MDRFSCGPLSKIKSDVYGNLRLFPNFIFNIRNFPIVKKCQIRNLKNF